MTFRYLQIKNILSYLMPYWDHFKIFIYNPQVVIHGSYYTTNVGDRIISLIIKNELSKQNIKSAIISRFSINPRSKQIIVGGGGILHNHYKDNLKYRTNFLIKNKKVLYIGIGCPGFYKMSNKEINQLKKLKYAKYISVRDTYSKNNIKNKLSSDKVNILVRSCPSWLYTNNYNIKELSIRNFVFRNYYNLKYYYLTKNIKYFSQNKPNIGITLRRFDINQCSPLVDKINTLKLYNNLIFIPFAGEDLEFYNKTLKKLKIHCAPLQNPISTLKLVSKMDKIVAARYHSVIFALLTKKPIMIIGYNEKIKQLANGLDLVFFDLNDNSREKLIFNTINFDKLSNQIKLAKLQLNEILDVLDY